MDGAGSPDGGHADPEVRGDTVFFETPNGGAVFAVDEWPP